MIKYVCVLVFLLIVSIYGESNENDFGILKTFLRTRLTIDEDNDYARWPKFTYKKLYRNHIYDRMSEATKALFIVPGVHPSCKQKKGSCIRRDRCREAHMLYISSICYTHDLVCCYDNYPPTDYKHVIVRDPEPKKEEKDEDKKEEEKNNEDNKGDDKKDNTKNEEGKKVEINKEKEDKDVKSLRSERENAEDFSMALLMPDGNDTAKWSLWLVPNVTKKEVSERVNSSVKVQELNFTRILAEFPELTAFLDNLPSQQNSTILATTANTTSSKSEKPKVLTVEPTITQNDPSNVAKETTKRGKVN